MVGGWDRSAEAWIVYMGENGDWSRTDVLDPAMHARLAGRRFGAALDVGCGEGRFCRQMCELGINTIGIDPTRRFIEKARSLDPLGSYQVGRAEDLEFEAESFDLVVSYLVLIDVADFRTAIAEMARVLKPGGTLLVANLTSFNSAGAARGWILDEEGKRNHFPVDRYLEEFEEWYEWQNMRMANHHRPLSAYMKAFLGAGLGLKFFDEPDRFRVTAIAQPTTGAAHG